jgi:ribosomal protein S18 acetylase RimI-like enzyme
MMSRSEIRLSLSNFGVARTVCDLALRAVNRAVLLKILKGVVIEKVDPRFLACAERYRFARLDEAALRPFAGTQEHELSEEFLREAFARGDECYGFLEGRALAAYGWYAHRPTPLETPGLVLHFQDRYVYMYKGFTHPAHRGQRLHAAGMTKALSILLERGYRGLVSYVEATNFGSLKSVYRMGYADFGTIVVLGLGGRHVTRASAGCAPYGFRVERARPAPVSLPTSPLPSPASMESSRTGR